MASAAASEDISFLRELGIDKCVFCQSAKTRRKVLFCLHLSCAVCLTEHLSGNNTIFCARCQVETPDPGPGRKLLDSLADWPDTITSSTSDTGSSGEQEPAVAGATNQSADNGSVSLCQDPDCDDYVAVSKCTSCDLQFCDVHSASHGRSKRTRDHLLTPLAAVGTGSDSDFAVDCCQLHPDEQVVKYCRECNAVLCVKCCAVHSSHTVVEVKTAAEESKEKLLEILAEEDSNGDQRIQQEARWAARASDQMDSIDTETSDLSEVITDDFQKCRELLSQRELEVKADLDKIRRQKVKPLEKAKEQCQERHGRLVAGKILLHSLRPLPLLRASAAMEESLVPVKRMSDDPAERAGLATTYTRYLERLTEESKEVNQLSGKPSPEAATPEHVAYCTRFDPQRKEADIKLSCQNQIASGCSVVSHDDVYLDWQAVGGVGCFKQGCVVFSVQLVEGPASTFLGISYPASPMPLKANTPNFLGWAGLVQHIQHVKGGTLGQPWQKDDVIKLTMNLDAKTPTGFHESSGVSDTIHLPSDSRYYCLRVYLRLASSVRLLVP